VQYIRRLDPRIRSPEPRRNSVRQACALLVDTEQPIAHVADSVGYANLANFNRQFRAAKGMTPRAFRRSFREGRR
jgi:AraC-like DNA-binding protein